MPLGSASRTCRQKGAVAFSILATSCSRIAPSSLSLVGLDTGWFG